MPNRIIKESICESRGLSECSIFAQDLYKRLIIYADDYGRFNADTQIITARLYPREADVVNEDDIISGLIELTGVNKIAFYTSEPRQEVYGCFPKWQEHQRIRDSKNKFPDPTDTWVNDWYYRRFIPMKMKIELLRRCNCKCAICGKNLNPFDTEIKRLIKMHTGDIHFDHIVPCNQGGRATFENIQVTCKKCNLTRSRNFTFEEILEFTLQGGESPQVAVSGGKIPPNPIQSESNPNPNPNPNMCDDYITSAEKPFEDDDGGAQGEEPGNSDEYTAEFEHFWIVYPRRKEKRRAFKAWCARANEKVSPEDMITAATNYAMYCRNQHTEEKFIKHPSTFLGPDKPYEEYINYHATAEIKNVPKNVQSALDMVEKYKREEEEKDEKE